MRNKLLFNLFVLVLLACTSIGESEGNGPPCEQICGKWESSEKNLIVQVSMQGNKFTAKMVFVASDSPELATLLDYWTDQRNPDPSLRNRKILGLSVLTNMTYMADTNSWEDGMIYDSKHGRTWNASAYIDKNGLLKVKGYWHFKCIGRTMTFKRV